MAASQNLNVSVERIWNFLGKHYISGFNSTRITHYLSLSPFVTIFIRSITRLSFYKWSLSSEFCCVLRFLKNYYHVPLQKALLLVIVSFDNLRLVIFPSVFQNKLWKSKPSWYYAIENFSFSKLNIFKSQNESLYEYRVILIVIAARL